MKTAISAVQIVNVTTNVNGGEIPTQCMCVCSSVRACVNAYMLHRELFVYHSKLLEAPAVSGLQLYVNDFVTIFI